MSSKCTRIETIILMIASIKSCSTRSKSSIVINMKESHSCGNTTNHNYNSTDSNTNKTHQQRVLVAHVLMCDSLLDQAIFTAVCDQDIDLTDLRHAKTIQSSWTMRVFNDIYIPYRILLSKIDIVNMKLQTNLSLAITRGLKQHIICPMLYFENYSSYWFEKTTLESIFVRKGWMRRVRKCSLWFAKGESVCCMVQLKTYVSSYPALHLMPLSMRRRGRSHSSQLLTLVAGSCVWDVLEFTQFWWVADSR